MESILQWFADNYEWLIPTILGLFGMKIGYSHGRKVIK